MREEDVDLDSGRMAILSKDGAGQGRVEVSRTAWTILASILAAAAIVVFVAPEERTLGEGMRMVYVHVALTWTGIAGFVVAGLIGVVLAIAPRPSLQSWMRTVGWVALLFFAAGWVTSALASQVNWGGVFWDEPRMAATMTGLAAALIVQIVNGWLRWTRAQGLLAVGLGVFLVLSVRSAPLVLHPGNPIATSSSLAIQLTFVGLFALMNLAAIWAVWFLRKRQLGIGP